MERRTERAKKMRVIKEVGMDQVEEYLDIYLNAYPAYKTGDEECREKYRKKTIIDMSSDKRVDFFGMFEDGKLVASMKLIDFDINLYGEVKHAIGIMALAVHPLYKKQRIAFEMIKFAEQYTEKSQALVAALLPFDMAFYRKMGYGLGSKMDQYHISTKSLPRIKGQKHLKFLSMDDLDQVLACHDRYAEQNHGMLKKFEEEVRLLRKDTSVKRVGYYDYDQLRGYAAYHFEEAHETNYTENRIVVDELIYDSGEVLKEFIGYFRNQEDLAQTIVLRSGEAEFYHIIDNPADISHNYIDYGYLQTNTSSIANMYKVIDPAKFVRETSHRKLAPVKVKVKFEYFDEISQERDEITIGFEPDGEGIYGRWFVSDQEPDVTINCKKGDLSSIFMNSARLGGLIDLGVVEIDKAEYKALVDMAFYSAQKPYSNSDF